MRPARRPALALLLVAALACAAKGDVVHGHIRGGPDPSIIAATRFGLANAMIAVGEDRDAALEHARDAAATYDGLGGRYVLERDRINAWIDGEDADQPGM